MSADISEDDVRKVEDFCSQSEELRKSVIWLADNIERDAVNGMASENARGIGYATVLANLSGQVQACSLIREMWMVICAGEMASGIRKQRELKERSVKKS